MISRAFHTWERRLASAATNRRRPAIRMGTRLAGRPSVIPETDERFDPAGRCKRGASGPSAGSERFYDVTPADDYALVDGVLTFTSAVDTPHRRRTTSCARATSPIASAARPPARRGGAAAVELPTPRATSGSAGC